MKYLIPFTYVILISTLTVSSANASSGWSVGHESEQDIMSDPNSGYYLKTATPFKDDITSDQSSEKIKLTDEQKHQAKVWGVSEKEEKRYVMLMQNKAGTYYEGKNMTPVEVLGFNARDNQERQYYAQKEATQMVERSSREKAFGADVQKSMDQLHKASGYPTVRDYNHEKYSPYSKHALSLQPGDKVVFFTKTTEQVKPITMQLIKSIEETKNTQLNIFLIDSNLKTEAANKWAKSQSIPVDMVNNKKITINLGKGQLNKVSKDGKTPTLILIRDGESESIDVGKF